MLHDFEPVLTVEADTFDERKAFLAAPRTRRALWLLRHRFLIALDMHLNLADSLAACLGCSLPLYVFAGLLAVIDSFATFSFVPGRHLSI